MRKALQRLLVLALLALPCAASAAGNCGIYAHKRNDPQGQLYAGTQAGYNSAKSAVGTNGSIFIYGGCEGQIDYGTIPDSVAVFVYDSGSLKMLGNRQTAVIPRLGPQSSPNEGGAVRIVDGVTFRATSAGIQAAIDDLPARGGMVLLPDTLYTGTATIYTPCDRPVLIVGLGPVSGGPKGTEIINTAGTDVIRLRGDRDQLIGVTVTGNATAAANEETGRGVVIGRRNMTDPYKGLGNEVTLGGGYPIVHVTLDHVNTKNTGGWGIFFSGYGKLSDGTTDESNPSAGVTLSIWNQVNFCTVQGVKKYGCVWMGKGCTTTTFKDCDFGMTIGKGGNNAYYAYLRENVSTQFEGCTFEGWAGGTKPWVYLFSAQAVTLRDPHFEEDAGDAGTATNPWFIQASDGCMGLVIERPFFGRHGSTSAGKPRLIQLGTVFDCTIISPTAFSATDLLPGGTWVERNHFDLGSTGWGVNLVGRGTLLNYNGDHYTIQVANVPPTSVMSGYNGTKIPAHTDADAANGARQMAFPGNLWVNNDVGGSSSAIDAAEWYASGSGGAGAGHRLFNNAPTMTRAQRDAGHPWVNGDIILISNPSVAGRDVQIRLGGAWYWLTRTVNVSGD